MLFIFYAINVLWNMKKDLGKH